MFSDRSTMSVAPVLDFEPCRRLLLKMIVYVLYVYCEYAQGTMCHNMT